MSAYSANFAGARVINRACELTGVAPHDIIGPRRTAELSEIRFACMAAMRAHKMTLPQIGQRLHRDHTTIMHGIKRAEVLREYPEYDALVSALEGV